MQAIRRALRERMTGGGAILSLAYLLVLQAVLASMAHGAMAATASQSLLVICASDGPVILDAGKAGSDGTGGPTDTMLRWHCATHCHAAAAGPAIPGPAANSLHAPAVDTISRAAPATVPPRPAFAGSLAEARAPPSSI